jgi:hypothetical protein
MESMKCSTCVATDGRVAEDLVYLVAATCFRLHAFSAEHGLALTRIRFVPLYVIR